MLGAWEILIILGVLVVIILWGPTKIPELARAVGKAKGEFDRASREYSSGTPKTQKPNPELLSDDMLFQLARAAGISTEGKGRSQIFQEIIQSLSLKTGSAKA